MRKTPERTQGQISCRRDEEAVVIDLSADDDREILFLTHDEARMLAFDLEAELVCAGTGAGEQPRASFAVADVMLTSDEAWQLLDTLQDLLRFGNPDDCGAKIDGVPWLKEGF